MNITEVKHAVVHDVGHNIDDLVQAGKCLMKFNIRSHGDDSDSYVFVEGYVHWMKDRKDPEKKNLVLSYYDPVDRYKQYVFEDEWEVFYRIREIIRII